MNSILSSISLLILVAITTTPTAAQITIGLPVPPIGIPPIAIPPILPPTLLFSILNFTTTPLFCSPNVTNCTTPTPPGSCLPLVNATVAFDLAGFPLGSNVTDATGVAVFTTNLTAGISNPALLVPLITATVTPPLNGSCNATLPSPIRLGVNAVNFTRNAYTFFIGSFLAQ